MLYYSGMAYNSDSAADRLSAVRDAIARCLTSQAYTIRGRSQQTAQLRDLRAMELELMQEVQEQSAGGVMASLGRMVPPS